MNKLVQLITTEGCEGCRIMDNLIQKSLEELSEVRPDVIYIRKDKDECDKAFLSEHNITDFPSTLFIRNDTVMHVHIGTAPKYTITSWILKYFGF